MYKSSKESQTEIVELMTPNYANFGGKIHGGHVLSLLDKAAYVCAAKHAETYCVTVAVDTVEFHHPIEVGELLHLYAMVNYVGTSSMVVGIKVVAENIKTRSVRHTNSCYITMVATTDEGKPSTVPGLILSNKTEVRRFIEAKNRRQAKQRFQDTFDKEREILKKIDTQDIHSALRSDNVQLDI